ncbi:MAG: glycosyltransferase [Chitinophagaceae bacterium]|nr:glycosyltransferase [Chitinophagaceae bacterium]
MSQLNQLRFAAFVMTYERPQILLHTIHKLFEQTLPPQKILVVDNSITEDSKNVIEQLNDSRVVYYRTGKNIGPAGASKIGLELLANDGYDWISWGDDDDPPHFPNVFEQLLQTASSVKNVGVIGAVGHKFDKKKGIVLRTSDALLDTDGYLDVDVIAGNVTMIVNADVVRKGVLPDPGFFLNVEEYDFCLRVKKAGFKVIADPAIFKSYRLLKGRMGLTERPKHVLPKTSVLWRRYYSTRNLIYMLNSNEKKIIAALNVSMRSFGKMLSGFRKGWSYGVLNALMEIKGIYHGWTGQMGLRVLPNKKY